MWQPLSPRPSSNIAICVIRSHYKKEHIDLICFNLTPRNLINMWPLYNYYGHYVRGSKSDRVVIGSWIRPAPFSTV